MALVYQSVVLDVDFENECLYGYTSLVLIQRRSETDGVPSNAASSVNATEAWETHGGGRGSGSGDAEVSLASVYESLGKSASCLVDNGTALRLHCRQCVIEKVHVNGEAAVHHHIDPSRNLSPGSPGEALDGFYREAIEASKRGELLIHLPASESEAGSEFSDASEEGEEVVDRDVEIELALGGEGVAVDRGSSSDITHAATDAITRPMVDLSGAYAKSDDSGMLECMHGTDRDKMGSGISSERDTPRQATTSMAVCDSSNSNASSSRCSGEKAIGDSEDLIDDLESLESGGDDPEMVDGPITSETATTATTTTTTTTSAVATTTVATTTAIPPGDILTGGCTPTASSHPSMAAQLDARRTIRSNSITSTISNVSHRSTGTDASSTHGASSSSGRGKLLSAAARRDQRRMQALEYALLGHPATPSNSAHISTPGSAPSGMNINSSASRYSHAYFGGGVSTSTPLGATPASATNSSANSYADTDMYDLLLKDYIVPLPNQPQPSKDVSERIRALVQLLQLAHQRDDEIIKVEVWYKLDQPKAGLTFRRYLNNCNGYNGSNGSNGYNGLTGSFGLHTCYGAGGGGGINGGMFNIDGVRCWLPCIDEPSQRAIFDVSMRLILSHQHTATGHSGATYSHTSSSYTHTHTSSDSRAHMKQSGAKESDILDNEEHQNRLKRILSLSLLASGSYVSMANDSIVSSIVPRKSDIYSYVTEHRFVTLTRVPVATLGVFIGNVNTHKSPLHATNGYLCVEARTPILADVPFKYINESFRDNNGLYNLIPPLKTGTFGRVVSNRSQLVEYIHFYPKIPEYISYAFMGFDQASKVLQRSLGKRFPHKSYVQVVLSDISGCANTAGNGTCGQQSLSFDGFSMIQASCLCADPRQLYLENSSHIQLINAFLNSWLYSCIPIQSHDDEFIITGVVGYLINSYIGAIYGREFGRHRFIKQYETVVSLEKQCVSNGSASVPSVLGIGFEYFSLAHSELCRSKAVVFMHLLEHRLRNCGAYLKSKVIKTIINSPEFTKKQVSQIASANSNAKPSVSNAGALGASSNINANAPAGSGTPMHIVSAASTPNASPLLTHQNSLQAYQTSFAPPSPFGGAGAIHSGANSMMHPTNAMGVHAFSKPALFPPPSPVHQGAPYFAPPSPYLRPYIPNPGGVINPLFPPASPLLLHPPAPHASISGGGSSGICNTTTNTTGNSSSTGTYVASGNKALVHGQQTGGQSAQNQGTAASAAIHSVSVQMLQSDAFACIDASEFLRRVVVAGGGALAELTLSESTPGHSTSTNSSSSSGSGSSTSGTSGSTATSAGMKPSGASYNSSLCAAFLDRFMRYSGVCLVRVGVQIDRRNERLHAVIQQIGYTQGRAIVSADQLNAAAATSQDIAVLTKPVVPPVCFDRVYMYIVANNEMREFTRPTEDYMQSVYVPIESKHRKPGRKRLVDQAASSKRSTAQLNVVQLLNLDLSMYTPSSTTTTTASTTTTSSSVLKQARPPPRGGYISALEQIRIPDTPAIHLAFFAVDPDIFHIRDMHFALSATSTSATSTTSTTSGGPSTGGSSTSATHSSSTSAAVKTSSTLANYTLLHMSIEQLFTDQEIAGQCRAIKTLVNCATQGESDSDTLLRMCALSDCLQNSIHKARSNPTSTSSTATTTATNTTAAASTTSSFTISDSTSDAVDLHYLTRARAAFALAQHQNTYGPLTYRSDLQSVRWIALRVLLAYVHSSYMDMDAHTRSLQPSPVDLADAEGTYLRSATILALSSIRAQSGFTPLEVVDCVVRLAENVTQIHENSPGTTTITSSSSDSSSGGGGNVGLGGPGFEGVQSAGVAPSQSAILDDSHYCSVLLLALSRLRIAKTTTSTTTSSSSGAVSVDVSMLCRMKQAAEYYLGRDAILSIATGHEDKTRANGLYGTSTSTTPTTGSISSASSIGGVLPESVELDDVNPCSVGRIATDGVGIHSSSSSGGSSVSYRAESVHYSDTTTARAPHRSSPSPVVRTPAGGILTASALQCLCEIVLQFHPIIIPEIPEFIRNWSLHQHSDGKSRTSMSNLASKLEWTPNLKSSEAIRELSFDFFPYVNPCLYSPLVRSAASECIIKLLLCKAIDATSEEDLMPVHSDVSNSARTHESISVKSKCITYALNFVMYIVCNDPDVSVRQSAATALLRCMQNANPLRATLAAISLGEVLDSFDWTDSSAFTATHSPRIEGYFKRDSSTSSSVMYRIRDAFRKDSSDVFANALSTFYECISTHRNVVYDQITRSTLMAAWLLCFKGNVPGAISNSTSSSSNSTSTSTTTTSALPTSTPTPATATSTSFVSGHAVLSALQRRRISGICNPIDCYEACQELLVWGTDGSAVDKSEVSHISTSSSSSSASSNSISGLIQKRSQPRIVLTTSTTSASTTSASSSGSSGGSSSSSGGGGNSSSYSSTSGVSSTSSSSSSTSSTKGGGMLPTVRLSLSKSSFNLATTTTATTTTTTGTSASTTSGSSTSSSSTSSSSTSGSSSTSSSSNMAKAPMMATSNTTTSSTVSISGIKRPRPSDSGSSSSSSSSSSSNIHSSGTTTTNTTPSTDASTTPTTTSAISGSVKLSIPKKARFSLSGK